MLKLADMVSFILIETMISDAHQKWKILQDFSALDMLNTMSKLTFWSLNGLHRTNGWGVMGTYFMHFNMGRLDTEIAKTGYNRSEWWNSSVLNFRRNFVKICLHQNLSTCYLGHKMHNGQCLWEHVFHKTCFSSGGESNT